MIKVIFGAQRVSDGCNKSVCYYKKKLFLFHIVFKVEYHQKL